MKRIISIIVTSFMLLGLVIPVNAKPAAATFTFESKTCSAGDTINVGISLVSTEAANSLGLSAFTYDANVLEFTGFTAGEVANTALMKTFNDTNKLVILGYQSATTFNGTVCTANFKVKDGAAAGTYEISATPTVKNGSTVITSAVAAATITVQEETPTAAAATFTFESKTCSAGDTINVGISLVSTEAANSLGLSAFTYDANVLEFTGFTAGEVANTALMKTFNDTNKLVILGYQSATTFNGTVCTANFKVKDGAAAGTYEISATPTVKNGSTVIDASVVAAVITVEGSQAHTHSYGPWTKLSDEQHQRECACGEKETAAHTWDAGEVTTAPTHTATGVKTYTCTACGATKTETIGVTTEHSYGAWTKVDDNNHKRVCECGDEQTEAHTWDNGVVTTKPTTTTEGVRTYTCSVCKGTKTETIAKLKEFTGLTLENGSFDYDGNEKGLKISGTLPEGADVTYVGNGKVNAGVYDVTATVTAEGYANLVLAAKLTITAKNLTVSGLSVQNKTYDGTTAAVVSGGALVGVITGDDVTATFPTQGTFTSANAGNDIAVSIADITLSGTKAQNYTLTQPTGLKANIAKAPIAVKADDITIIKGAAIPALTYTITSGQLFGNDQIGGSLATTATGADLGNFDITGDGLSVSDNYVLTFTKGTLTVVDKTPQTITIGTISEKTYGGEAFNVSVTPDSVSGLTAFTYESSNTGVAEINANGVVTIKGAGQAEITVKQAGNAVYAPAEAKATLTVNKKNLTVSGLSVQNKTYDGTTAAVISGGALVGVITGDDVTATFPTQGTFTSANAGDDIAVSIAEITLSGAKAQNYTLTQPTGLKANIVKASQQIAIGTIADKAYGDEAFNISVTPDSTSGLTAFTYESSNTDVAEIDANGLVTIKGVGETEITVNEAGNGNFTAAEAKATLVVNKKGVEITEINVEEKTVTFASDLTAEDLDFDKLSVSKSFEGTTVTITVTNFVLKGDKAANYVVTTQSREYTATATESTETVTEGITATTVVYDDTAKVDVTDSSTLSESTAVIDVTAENNVNAVAISASALNTLASNDNAIEIKVKDETGANASIIFNKNALDAMTSGVTSDIIIRISNPDDSELTDDQQEKKEEVSSKNPVVFSLTVEGAATTEFAGNNVTVTLPYDKGTANGNIVVKFVDEDGTVETITNNANYDSANKTITVALPHFSEYIVYTEPQVVSRGGSAPANVTVKFNTNGGDALSSISVLKGQKISNIKEPTKKGYVFTGWYYDETLTKSYSADDKVTESITLYAGWKADTVSQIILTIGDKNATVFGEVKANDVAPLIRNDRTMLPIRFVAEALGAKVDWDGETRTVTITSGETVITIVIDQSFATVNGTVIELDSPAFIESDRTFLPIRFVSENLGAEVEWVEATRQVVITKPIEE